MKQASHPYSAVGASHLPRQVGGCGGGNAVLGVSLCQGADLGGSSNIQMRALKTEVEKGSM